MAERKQRCRSCDAEIIWAETKNGKAMPIDASPVANGNIDLVDSVDPRQPPTALYLNKRGERELTPGGDLYAPKVRFVSHFVTCPDAEAHRK